MNQILAMREKRASLWDAAKKYRDAHIANDGTMTAEDAAVYDRKAESETWTFTLADGTSVSKKVLTDVRT